MAQAASPLALLQGVADSLPAEWLNVALAGRIEALEAIQDQARRSDRWAAATALQLAHLWLVAGRSGRGDDLVLEAQQQLPGVGIVPDWWGLWPSETALNGRHPEVIGLAECYIQLRHLPPLQAWKAWLQTVQADRHRCAEPALQLLLGLVVHGRKRLPGALEPALEQLLGEELVAAEPALAWRLLDPLCERLPQWNFARLKAADLSLQRGELERCGQHLEQASAEQWQLAWLHDIAARHALAIGDVAKALEHWQQAIARCSEAGNGADAAVVEIFRQRARDARRGPGVLQARSLLNRGQTSEAITLLEQLLAQDPQWQPLRSLLEQARGTGPAAQIKTSEHAGGDLERLEQRLKQLAECAQLRWPPADLPDARDAADAERFVQDSLGRLALLR